MQKHLQLIASELCCSSDQTGHGTRYTGDEAEAEAEAEAQARLRLDDSTGQPRVPSDEGQSGRVSCVRRSFRLSRAKVRGRLGRGMLLVSRFRRQAEQVCVCGAVMYDARLGSKDPKVFICVFGMGSRYRDSVEDVERCRIDRLETGASELVEPAKMG